MSASSYQRLCHADEGFDAIDRLDSLSTAELRKHWPKGNLCRADDERPLLLAAVRNRITRGELQWVDGVLTEHTPEPRGICGGGLK